MADVIKPCRLEMNVMGSWRVLYAFNAADEQLTDDLMNSAGQLAEVINEDAGRERLKLRIVTDESYPATLMRYAHGDGWRDARTGESA